MINVGERQKLQKKRVKIQSQLDMLDLHRDVINSSNFTIFGNIGDTFVVDGQDAKKLKAILLQILEARYEQTQVY